MSLLKYFTRRDGLSDPRGSLSNSVPSRAIAVANREVEKELARRIKKTWTIQKVLLFNCYLTVLNHCYVTFACSSYSAKERAEIGKYSQMNGVARTARYFTRKLNKTISESTVRSIQKLYQSELERKRRHGEDEIELLQIKKRGRSLLLGQDIDKRVQDYLKKVREGGGVVSARIVIAAARGLLLHSDRTKLVEFGGHVELNRH